MPRKSLLEEQMVSVYDRWKKERDREREEYRARRELKEKYGVIVESNRFVTLQEYEKNSGKVKPLSGRPLSEIIPKDGNSLPYTSVNIDTGAINIHSDLEKKR